MSTGRYSDFKFITATTIILFSSLLGGCAFLNEKTIDNPFDGLTTTMNATPNTITCVLFVHGMGGYSNAAYPGDPKGDPNDIVAAILKLPHMQRTAAEKPVDLDDANATLTRQDFVDTGTHQQLRTYTLDWEPLNADLKNTYLAYDQQEPWASRRLNLINANLRADILDDAVPDVVLYVGHYKPVIQHAVKQALKRMHEDIESRSDKQNDYQYVFVTWSLGSKIVFDCLADPKLGVNQSPTTDPIGDEITFKKIAGKTRAVFMLANQLPLLTLGDVQPATKSTTPNAKPYEAVLSMANRHTQASSQPSTAPKVAIVAFSDPNDLLSYPLPTWLKSDNATFTNVSISIATTAVYIPFLGWVYNPKTAHTGYALNDEVVNLILNGGTK